MKFHEGQRIFVKFCFKLGKTITDTLKMLHRGTYEPYVMLNGIDASNQAEHPLETTKNLGDCQHDDSHIETVRDMVQKPHDRTSMKYEEN